MKKFVFLGILLTVLLPLITGCNLYDDTVNDLDNIEIFIPDDVNRLRAAALLHDITKKLDLSEHLQICSRYYKI